jgi:hypothetical protein
MTENDRLYLPGSDLDGLTFKQAQAKASRAARQPDRGASGEVQDQGRNPSRSPAGDSRSDPLRRASGDKSKRSSRGASERKPAMLPALVRAQILQLASVLGAIVAFYVAFRLGWV